MKFKDLYRTFMVAGLLASLPYACHDGCTTYGNEADTVETRQEKVERAPAIERTETIEALVERE